MPNYRAENNFKTNELFIKAFEQSGLNQSQFSRLINKSQPNIWAYLNNVHEIRYSEFERYMDILGQKFDIQIKEDVVANTEYFNLSICNS